MSRNARAKRKCAKKVTYASQKAAETAAWSLRRKGGPTERVHAYKCQICDGFHVGHPSKRVRQSIRDRRARETA